MDDMQAFEERANERRAAIGKPKPVVWPPLVPYRKIKNSLIGLLFLDAQEHDTAMSICLEEIAEIVRR